MTVTLSLGVQDIHAHYSLEKEFTPGQILLLINGQNS